MVQGAGPKFELTVCVCSHDRPGYVQNCLGGLQRQTVSPGRIEVLVVDSASTGKTPARLATLLAGLPDARLIRLERPGISLARNAGAQAARAPFIAYIDDDAVPEPNWAARILAAIRRDDPPAAVIGGRILPKWEAPLPRWWPASLRGVLTIIEHEHGGEYRTAALPDGVEPYGANMVVHVPSLLAAGGFADGAGRIGASLLSDEEVQLAWRLQDAGGSARYDPGIVVRHQIQAARLRPEWLLSRLFWQGISSVGTYRMIGRRQRVWWRLPRRLAVLLLLWPLALLPARSTRLIGGRWRLAYSAGFAWAALGGHPVAPPRAMLPNAAA